jgi:16S rRNA (cytosine967-C5)-methyltransferase
VQRALLESAAKTLKPGGVLLYATCTTEPEENAGAVHSFLRAHPEFQVESPAPRLLGKRADALTPEGFIQLWPHRHDTDGFFMARLRKA